MAGVSGRRKALTSSSGEVLRGKRPHMVRLRGRRTQSTPCGTAPARSAPGVPGSGGDVAGNTGASGPTGVVPTSCSSQGKTGPVALVSTRPVAYPLPDLSGGVPFSPGSPTPAEHDDGPTLPRGNPLADAPPRPQE